LTSIATNVDFGDLRSDMVTSRIIDETHRIGDSPAEIVEMVARYMGALELVLFTVEIMSDDIARTAQLRALLDVITNHPDYKPPREIRRLAIVDDHLRSLDD
jgi:hypothetical protein